MEKSPKLREARFEDYAQIAPLVSKFGLRIEDYSAWTHLWTENPAYRAFRDRVPIGWVLETGEGTVSGYLGNIPITYELHGKRLLAATTRAWVVDTPYRSYSPLLLANYFQQRAVDLFLSTTVNPLSEAAYSSFQSTRMTVGAWDRTLFWITNYRGFVASYLRKNYPAIARPASYPLSFGLFLKDRVVQSRSPRSKAALTVAACSTFDDRFQVFWEALRRMKSNVLLADRSQEALDWHFKFALQQNSAWIYVVENKSGLTAYSIFLRHDYQQLGLTRVRLVDFQCLDTEDSTDMLFSMLNTAIERCRKESIHMFELVGVTPELEQKLEPASPHRRSLGSWLYFYKTNNTSLAKELKRPDVWEPSLFDGDSSL